MRGIENFPLKEKPTIETYQWSDSSVFLIDSSPEYIKLNSDEYLGKLNINDVAMMAKHFGLLYDNASGGHHCVNCEVKGYG